MSSIPVPPGAPPAARGKTTGLDGPSPAAKQAVLSNRLFIVSLMLCVVIIGLLAVILVMMPLKRTEPILVERDTSTGAVRAVATSNDVYRPQQSDLKYFLNRYVAQIVSINRLTTERDIEDARSHFTRGKAVAQLDAYFEKERPIARLRADPGLSRKYELGSVSIFKDGAVVKFATVEQGSTERESKRVKYVATIQFSLVAPDDEKAIFSNPAGLFITDLDITRDLES